MAAHDSRDRDEDTIPAVEALRSRVHRISDMVHAHEGKLGEHSVLISVNVQQLESLRQSACTREQFDHGMSNATSKLDALHLENRLKLENFDTKLDALDTKLDERFGPMIRGINAVVWMIVTGFVGGLLYLLWHAAHP